MSKERTLLKEQQNGLTTMILNQARVGQINPYPEFKVMFSTLAKVAIQKGQRGILVLLLEDATSADKTWTTLKTSADLVPSEWTAENVKLINTAFETFPPSKVMVRRKGETTTEAFLKELEVMKLSQLACPTLDTTEDAKVVNWIKANVETKGVVYVSAFANNSDNCGVVELNNATFKHSIIGTMTKQQATVMVAGAIAGCPLNRSLDNCVFPNLLEVDVVTPVNGKFSFYNEDEKVRVVLATNSKTTFDSTWSPETRCIKIFEGINIVRQDIQDTFKNYWCGLYLNTYENKIAFCRVVTDVYFKELQPNVLSPDMPNYIDVSSEANRKKIVLDGKDPDTMTETEIRTYNTGTEVLLEGAVSFINTMINLNLNLQY